MTPNTLADRRLLVVEDDFLIARDLAEAFQALGADVLGPVASVDDALDLLDDTDRIDGAVLDLNLQGEMSYPVADALLARGVPVAFTTGYDQSVIPPRYAGVPRCEKPVEAAGVVRALFR